METQAIDKEHDPKDMGAVDLSSAGNVELDQDSKVVDDKDSLKLGPESDAEGTNSDEDDKENEEDKEDAPVPSHHIVPPPVSDDKAEGIVDYDEPEVLADNAPPLPASPAPKSSPLKSLYEAAFSSQPMLRSSSSSSHSLAPSSRSISRNGSAIDLTPVVKTSPGNPSFNGSIHTSSVSPTSKRTSKDSVETMSPVDMDEVPLDGDATADDQRSTSPSLTSPPPTAKSSIFGNLGFFSSTPGASSSSPAATQPHQPNYSRSSSSSSSVIAPPTLGEKVRQTSTSWRTGFSNLLSAAPKSPNEPLAELPSESEVYTPRSLHRPPMDRNVSSSTAFLLHQVTNSSDVRRRSSEGVKGLKEGFEQKRMRAVMETVARDTRQTGQGREQRLMEAEEYGEGDGEEEEDGRAGVQEQDDGVVEGVDWRTSDFVGVCLGVELSADIWRALGFAEFWGAVMAGL